MVSTTEPVAPPGLNVFHLEHTAVDYSVQRAHDREADPHFVLQTELFDF